ncbi:uncharacterized protein LOC131293887 [Anopheles ziemanni]|uniref:uncharacterized protein LOC131264653 n=1 Tax=Anopheles coustani TaxID=139045 RepID=UPI0026587026|nr:uncharacterized protein LOC131264653 [Anopheles coustani]XP_058177920.1 uncharacterized protein LOC131293887 [Anopheles ziemanni]
MTNLNHDLQQHQQQQQPTQLQPVATAETRQGQQHRYHLHHDPAYNITTAEADLDYNSDNSIAVLHQHHNHLHPQHHQHHQQQQQHHHHRYMPSSSSSCDNTKQPTRLGGGSSSAGGSCDENTPSVLDINLDTKKISLAHQNGSSRHNSPARFGEERKYGNNHHHNHHHHHHIEVYSDGANGLDISKLEEEISEDDRGPPLPPRPAPRSRTLQRMETAPTSSGVRKYVIWCLICGGISSLLGVLFLGIYFLLRSYTSTVGYFETVPTFVPATLLMLTGICIMSLARRRNRYSYLIKLSGACGLASALTCALVTVTTTVLHMSRLQVLRECEYTQKTRTCTCYSVTADKQTEGVDDSVRFVFDSTSDCGVVHGALYSCLRAVFGLSVAGVLVAVFSCMLVYQLLSHERKKMYWEQLELRCRSLYAGQQGPASVLPSGPGMLGSAGVGGPGTVVSGRTGNCRCCEQCHAHRNVLPTAYPWEGDGRFWTPGQAGNFYSPNPGGDEPGTVSGGRLNTSGRRMPGWSWPRMPWQRNDATQRLSPHSPDSQYGFSNGRSGMPMPMGGGGGGVVGALLGDAGIQPRYNVIDQQYGIWGPPPPYSDPNSPARRGRYQYIHPSQCGPPLIDANGPSGLPPNGGPGIAILECHQHAVMGVDVHGIPQQYMSGPTGPPSNMGSSGGHPQASNYSRGGSGAGGGGGSGTGGGGISSGPPGSSSGCTNGGGTGCGNPGGKRQQTGGYTKMQTQTKDNYENTPSDSDGPGRDRFSNTLPLRKAKKRVETAGAKSIGPNNGGQHQPASRVNVQNVFGTSQVVMHSQHHAPPGSLETSENEYNEPNLPSNGNGNGAGNVLGDSCDQSAENQGPMVVHPPKTRRLKSTPGGIENSGFQTVESLEAEAALSGKLLEPTESEVYFADVSSCCNMSVKNDNYYEDAGQRRKKDKQQQLHQDQADDYIAQRFGKREPSVRSRLPFPQASLPLGHDTSSGSGFGGTGGDKPPVMPRSSLLPKDISRQSMCSVDSGEKTDYTDLSPATPSTNNNNFPSIAAANGATGAASGNKPMASLEPTTVRAADHDGGPGGCNFIASYPYSSNEQSQEAHRRSTKNLHDIFLAPDSQYEVMKELHRFKTTPLTLTPFELPSSTPSSPSSPSSSHQDMPVPFPPASFGSAPPTTSATMSTSALAPPPPTTTTTSMKPKSPKNLNITPIKRQSLGTNISSIIQNLSGNDVGLLYPEGLRHSATGQSSGAPSSGGIRSDINDSVSSNEDNEELTDGIERLGVDRRL